MSIRSKATLAHHVLRMKAHCYGTWTRGYLLQVLVMPASPVVGCQAQPLGAAVLVVCQAAQAWVVQAIHHRHHHGWLQLEVVWVGGIQRQTHHVGQASCFLQCNSIPDYCNVGHAPARKQVLVWEHTRVAFWHHERQIVYVAIGACPTCSATAHAGIPICTI